MEPQQTLYSHLTLLLWERESSSYSMDHVKLWNQRWKIETLLVRLERVLYVFSFAVQCRDWKCIAAKPTLKLQKLQTSKKGVREKESGETTSDNMSIFHVIVMLNHKLSYTTVHKLQQTTSIFTPYNKYTYRSYLTIVLSISNTVLLFYCINITN